jgi:hypothetical protein
LLRNGGEAVGQHRFDRGRDREFHGRQDTTALGSPKLDGAKSETP